MFKNKNKRIFLDYAAGTPVSETALAAFNEASRHFANPQALHTEGLAAARVRDDARSAIARILGVKSSELIFTSGGTEANNLALAGYLGHLEAQGVPPSECHVVASAIEHPSVSKVLAPFIARGMQVSWVAPNEHGEIKPDTVRDALQENTVLVTVALVNSEIGTVQPLHAVGKVLKAMRPTVGEHRLERVILHTDACQGLYQSPVPQGLGVDLMSFDAGKMYGPRGVGALYLRHGVQIAPVLRGGSQESGLRPGTEPVALYAGFAAAFEEAAAMREAESKRLAAIREKLLTMIHHSELGAVVNGAGKHQSPHILNISIPDIDAEYVAMYLDQRGVALSTKSACLERTDAAVSHVVAALGGAPWRAATTLRLSFGRDTTEADVPLIVEKIKEAVHTYRSFKRSS